MSKQTHFIHIDSIAFLFSSVKKIFCRTLGRIGATSEGNCYDEGDDSKDKRLLGFIWGVHVHKDFCSLFEQDWS